MEMQRILWSYEIGEGSQEKQTVLSDLGKKKKYNPKRDPYFQSVFA